MALQHPSQEHILQFIACTQSDEPTAVQFLQHAGDLATAVNNFFDTGGVVPTQSSGEQNINTYEDWDHLPQGNPFDDHQDHLPSFQIHAHDSPAAPTRPPSRVSQGSTAAMYGSQYGDIGTQENGLVGQSGPFFGPATKDHYDQNEWALTVPAISVSEVISDLHPADRRRDEGQPVSMKPMTRQEALPALITILGTIPRARQVLLCPEFVRDSYGSSASWFAGVPIEQADPVHEDEDPLRKKHLELVWEVQRLMAFTGASERLYGNVTPLSNLAALSDVTQEEEQAYPYHSERFLLAWRKAMEYLKNDPASSNLFLTSFKHDRSDLDKDTEVRMTSFRLGANMVRNTSDRTLYGLLDEVLWRNEDDGPIHGFSTIPEVLVLSFEQPRDPHNGAAVKFPLSWYIDRYMLQNRDQMAWVRERSQEVNEVIREIDAEIEDLETFVPVTASSDAERSSYKSSDLFKSTIEYLRKKSQDSSALGASVSEASGAAESSAGVLSSKNPNLQTSSSAMEVDVENSSSQLADRLKGVCDRLHKKIDDLKTQRQMFIHDLNELSDSLKRPHTSSSGEPVVPKNEYHLRGLWTGETIYVLCSRPDFPDQGQWWRIKWEATPDISTVIVSEDDVLYAACGYDRNVTLVYSRDSTLTPPPEVILAKLPPALAAFVNIDNGYFSDELWSRHDYANDLQDAISSEDPLSNNEMEWAGMNTVGPVDGADARDHTMIHIAPSADGVQDVEVKHDDFADSAFEEGSEERSEMTQLYRADLSTWAVGRPGAPEWTEPSAVEPSAIEPSAVAPSAVELSGEGERQKDPPPYQEFPGEGEMKLEDKETK